MTDEQLQQWWEFQIKASGKTDHTMFVAIAVAAAGLALAFFGRAF